MAERVTIHRPDQPDSTMRVTTKAFHTVYAGEGYVRGQHGAPEVDAADVARLQAQLADAQRQLAEAKGAPASTTQQPAKAPAKRAPRVRNRGTKAPAAPPAPSTAEEPSPGPADVPSTSPDDQD